MTRDKILAMTWGRELDELVSTKVMLREPGLAYGYSSAVGRAWEVVEQLQSRGKYADVTTFADFYEVAVRDNSGADICAVSSPRLAEAICKAALIAWKPSHED